jgi:hypothetical protein
MKLKVSIIMPVLNGEKYIGEAVESILAQTYKAYELIVINDGSTDGTCDRLKQFADRADVKCIHHGTRQGIARSVNDALRQSSGQCIAFLDHDDLWLPHFLEVQMSHLDRHPDVGMVHSDFQTIDPEGRILEASVATCRKRKRVSGHVFRELFMDSFIVGNSVLIRKECFDRLGLFDETLRIGDYHMWLRIARHYKVDYTPQVLTAYRQHATQDSRSYAGVDPHQEPVGLQVIRSILQLYPEVAQELGERTIRRRMASLYFDLAHGWFSGGARGHARVALAKAIRLWPTDPRYYMLYAGSLLQPSQANVLRKIWRAVNRMRMASSEAVLRS